MKKFLLLFLFMLSMVIPTLAQSAIRQDATRRVTAFTTVSGSGADTFRFTPAASYTVIKHTTVLNGSGAVTPLLDSVAITLNTTNARLGDQALIQLQTAGTARKVKFFGSSISISTAEANATISTNKLYSLLFVYDGAVWRRTVASTTP